jgi:hypothetical protein
VELMRVAWRTVGSIVARVSADIDARVDRLAGLRRIGIGEIAYKRGHRYLLVVVDHDTGALVWAAPGRDETTLRRFALRVGAHPGTGTVPRWRFDPIPTGFVLELEEAWDAEGEHWTCRGMFRADMSDAGITELSVYCTGDWDAARRAEHGAAVRLLRP